MIENNQKTFFCLSRIFYVYNNNQSSTMKQFKNIFLNLSTLQVNVNFRKLVETRRAKLIDEGYNVNNVNWEHYAKVLEAKSQQIASL
jgi:hypothetical protein